MTKPVTEQGQTSPVVKHEVMRRLGATKFLAVGALVGPPLGLVALIVWGGEIGLYLRGQGDLGLVMYVVAFMVLAGLALLPTYIQSGLGGFAFGLTLGIPASLMGFAGGAVIGYEVARRVSGDRVQRLVEEKPRWKAVRDALVGDGSGHGFWKTLGMVALLRLPPNSPFALTNLVMASVKVPRLPFILGTLIGMAPRTSIAVVIGAGLKESFSKDALDEAKPAWVWPVSIGVTLVIVVVIGLIADRAIKRVTRRGEPAA